MLGGTRCRLVPSLAAVPARAADHGWLLLPAAIKGSWCEALVSTLRVVLSAQCDLHLLERQLVVEADVRDDVLVAFGQAVKHNLQ